MKRKLLLVVTIVMVMSIAGCANYKIEVGDSKLELTYFLQDKNFKHISYDPNTHTFTIESFGSETSQIVGEAIRAALEVKPL